MPIQFTDYSDPNKWAQNKYEGIGDILPNMLAGYKAAKYPEEQKTEQELKKAQTIKALREAREGNFAPTNLGKLIQERDAIAARNPNDPRVSQYDKVIDAQGGSKFAPSGLGKLYGELEEVKQGYLPGSNGMIPIDPLKQKQLEEAYKLKIQASTSDVGTRQTALRGENLLKSINASNIDALTRYSGITGALNLKKEQAKDLAGNPSEEYLQYLEAEQAVKLEAKELRQFFGDSITPQATEAIDKMVNATSLTKSPEAAKRMIQKSRETIKKQIDTFKGALKSQEAYGVQNQEEQFVQQMQNAIKNAQSNQLPSMADIEYTAKKHGMTIEEVKRQLGIE